jgi:hypothetical protein
MIDDLHQDDRDGLLLTNLDADALLIRFTFRFFMHPATGGPTVLNFRFLTANDGVTTSKPSQVLVSHGVVDATPISPNLVPVREDDAVLMTVQQAPSTWAATNYLIKLILRGIIQWQWNVAFEVPMFPFRLDGTWMAF